MSTPEQDVHDRIFDEIDAQLGTLEFGAPTTHSDGSSWTQEELAAALADLQSDKDALLAHWKIRDGMVAADAPPRTRACGQPQPCPHVLGLARKYDLI